jgi:hypothetical protein
MFYCFDAPTSELSMQNKSLQQATVALDVPASAPDSTSSKHGNGKLNSQ